MHKMLKNAGRRKKLLVDSDVGRMGLCLLPSYDMKALDFTLLSADEWLVVAGFVLHILIWAAVF